MGRGAEGKVRGRAGQAGRCAAVTGSREAHQAAVEPPAPKMPRCPPSRSSVLVPALAPHAANYCSPLACSPWPHTHLMCMHKGDALPDQDAAEQRKGAKQGGEGNSLGEGQARRVVHLRDAGLCRVEQREGWDWETGDRQARRPRTLHMAHINSPQHMQGRHAQRL